MTPIETDVAIIGVGSAGMTAYKAARKHTDKIITIEAHDYGTTCARVGCMPSKLLIAAALAANNARQSAALGVHVAGVDIDGAAVMQRVRSERDRFVQYSLDDVAAWPAAHKLRGFASFTGPNTLRVGTRDIQAKSIVIATGSTPQLPADWRAQLGERLISTDDVFHWHTLPQSIAIVGTGIIGLELASALHALGVRVRLLGRSGKAGPATDPAIAQACAHIFGQRIPSALRSTIHSMARSESGVRIAYTTEGAQAVTEESFDCVLMATGRSPNLQGLALEKAGVVLGDKGLPTFDRQTRQIEDKPIFIAGDANQSRPLLHEAADDGYAAGTNAARVAVSSSRNSSEHGAPIEKFPQRAALTLVFSLPQIALAGQSHAALRQAKVDFATGAASFENQGRARIDQTNEGLLHVYGERGTGRFLGAEMVGPAAEHLGHLLAWAVQQEQTVAQMLSCPFYHPTVEEGLRSALQKLQKALNQPASAS